jgi:plasmid maintenance system killer protein
VGAVVVQSKILSDIIITILCAVLVFQSTIVVGLYGYAIYTQPLGTAAATTTTMKLSSVTKMLVDNAIQEFQSHNINNAITYLQGAGQELSSSLAIAGNNRNNNNSTSVSTSITQPLTILLLVKNIIQSLDSGDYGNGQKYLNLAEQELGRNILVISSSPLNDQTKISTSNATYNNNSNDNYSFFSMYTNTKYGIKLQYPHEWVIEADDYATGAAGQAGIQIASFYLPDVNNGLPFFAEKMIESFQKTK